MKNCKYCMSEIHENATICPVCKRRIDWKTFDKYLTIILFSIVGLLLFVAILIKLGVLK